MKEPYKRWRNDLVLFLDEGFDQDEAFDRLKAENFLIERFRKHFQDALRGREHGVDDSRVIRFCNRKSWILLTTDANMYHAHRKELAAAMNIGVLATAHNNPENLMEWAEGVCKLKSILMRNSFKKHPRPWFACFSRQGAFTVPPKSVTWSA